MNQRIVCRQCLRSIAEVSSWGIIVEKQRRSEEDGKSIKTIIVSDKFAAICGTCGVVCFFQNGTVGGTYVPAEVTEQLLEIKSSLTERGQ